MLQCLLFSMTAYICVCDTAKFPPSCVPGRYMKKQFNKWKDKMQFLHNCQEDKSCKIEAKLQSLRASHENLQMKLQQMKQEVKVCDKYTENHHSYGQLLNTNYSFSCRPALLILFHAPSACLLSHFRFLSSEKADRLFAAGVFLSFCMYLASSTDTHVWDV